MPTRRVRFPGVAGTELVGLLDEPDGAARGWAVFAHCFTCSKDSLAASRVSRALAARGIGVLRYDVTGLGESGGEFSEATFSTDVDDLVLAAAHLRETGRAPSLLVGHSLGGAAVVAAAGRLPEVTAVVTIGAPADPAHLAHLLGPVTDELREQGRACLTIAGREFTVTRALLDDLGEQAQDERLRTLDAALLVLHAPGDRTVGIDNARRVFDAARHPKSFVALDGADHLLTRPADSRWVADLVSSWAERYLPDDGTPAEDDADAPGGSHGVGGIDDGSPSAEGTVVVTETGGGPFVEHVRAGRHTFVADEPVSIPGGTDTGPGPYDLLLAALGTCTAMTVRMYADRKRLPLERVRVTLGQRHVHADDLGACVGGGEDCVRQLVREIELVGDLDDVQRGKLLDIAGRCPVHRTLEAGVEVLTSLAGEPPTAPPDARPRRTDPASGPPPDPA